MASPFFPPNSKPGFFSLYVPKLKQPDFFYFDCFTFKNSNFIFISA